MFLALGKFMAEPGSQVHSHTPVCLRWMVTVSSHPANAQDVMKCKTRVPPQKVEEGGDLRSLIVHLAFANDRLLFSLSWADSPTASGVHRLHIHSANIDWRWVPGTQMFVHMSKLEGQDPCSEGADIPTKKRPNKHDKIHTYQLCKDTRQEQNTNRHVWKGHNETQFCMLVN